MVPRAFCFSVFSRLLSVARDALYSLLALYSAFFCPRGFSAPRQRLFVYFFLVGFLPLRTRGFSAPRPRLLFSVSLPRNPLLLRRTLASRTSVLSCLFPDKPPRFFAESPLSDRHFRNPRNRFFVRLLFRRRKDDKNKSARSCEGAFRNDLTLSDKKIRGHRNDDLLKLKGGNYLSSRAVAR